MKVTRNSGPRVLVRNDGVTDEIVKGRGSSSPAHGGGTTDAMRATLIDAIGPRAIDLTRPPERELTGA
jgi:hypothetical protein